MKYHPYLPQNLIEDLKSEGSPATTRSVEKTDVYADMYERRRAQFVLEADVRNVECVAPMISNSGPDMVTAVVKKVVVVFYFFCFWGHLDA